MRAGEATLSIVASSGWSRKPLVENSFKHGVKGDINNTFLTINIEQSNNAFLFKIENNYTEKALEENDEYSGLGLENIQENLKIVYPNKHEFKILKTELTFLKIKYLNLLMLFIKR